MSSCPATHRHCHQGRQGCHGLKAFKHSTHTRSHHILNLKAFTAHMTRHSQALYKPVPWGLKRLTVPRHVRFIIARVAIVVLVNTFKVHMPHATSHHQHSMGIWMKHAGRMGIYTLMSRRTTIGEGSPSAGSGVGFLRGLPGLRLIGGGPAAGSGLGYLRGLPGPRLIGGASGSPVQGTHTHGGLASPYTASGHRGHGICSYLQHAVGLKNWYVYASRQRHGAHWQRGRHHLHRSDREAS